MVETVGVDHLPLDRTEFLVHIEYKVVPFSGRNPLYNECNYVQVSLFPFYQCER